MKKKPTKTCVGCSFLKSAALDSDPSTVWDVCVHESLVDIFVSGRAVDLDDAFPEWCPAPKTAKEFEVMTYRDNDKGRLVVRARHISSNLLAECSEFKSTHKNRETAMERLMVLIRQYNVPLTLGE